MGHPDLAPDGSVGWWDKTGTEPLGQIFIWGISDTADLAAYGLIDAQLCSDAGTSCVAPSTASLTAALALGQTPDSAGLLQVNPASPGAGGISAGRGDVRGGGHHQSRG